jgi:hypothetical protein
MARFIALVTTVTRCDAGYAVIWSHSLKVIDSRDWVVVQGTAYNAGLA